MGKVTRASRALAFAGRARRCWDARDNAGGWRRSIEADRAASQMVLRRSRKSP